MRRALTVALAALALTAGACTKATNRSAEVGETAPTFSTRDLSGQRIRLVSYRGETVVLNFWASWCVPCRKEFPLLAALDKREGVVVLGVVFNDSVDNARDFMEANGGTWPGLRDDGGIARAYEIGPGIPATIVIGPDGKVRQRHIGELRSVEDLQLEG